MSLLRSVGVGAEGEVADHEVEQRRSHQPGHGSARSASSGTIWATQPARATSMPSTRTRASSRAGGVAAHGLADQQAPHGLLQHDGLHSQVTRR